MEIFVKHLAQCLRYYKYSINVCFCYCLLLLYYVKMGNSKNLQSIKENFTKLKENSANCELVLFFFLEKNGIANQIAIVFFSLFNWQITKLSFSRTDHDLFSFQPWLHHLFSASSVVRQSKNSVWFFYVSQLFLVVGTFWVWKVAALDISLWISNFNIRWHAKSS